ncbi:hypothetical protein [Gemmata algarum]
MRRGRWRLRPGRYWPQPGPVLGARAPRGS